MVYEALKLEHQLCFPLYACSREITKRYKPYLDEIGLTYTQYVVMLVLWEREQVTVKELGGRLYLDSGTLTPLLKRLAAEGLIVRTRSAEDERSVIISLSERGDRLREKAKDIPQKIAACLSLSQEDAGNLYRILYLILESE